MLPKNSKSSAMDDFREEEEDTEEEADNNTSDESLEENSEEEHDEKPKQKSLVEFIDDMVDDDWSGKIEKDLDLVKSAFSKYLLSIQLANTPLIKEFTRKYQREIKEQKRQNKEDGVQKDIDQVEEEAFDAAFAFFEQRLEDVVRQIYRHNNIEEENEEDDITKDEIDESGQLGAGIGKSRRRKRFVKRLTPYNVRNVIRPLTQLELYKSRLANGNQD